MRVFINDKAVDVPRGARVRDAVAQADDGLARLLGSAAYVTDAAGRPIDAAGMNVFGITRAVVQLDDHRNTGGA